jgi:hypothetical protein
MAEKSLVNDVADTEGVVPPPDDDEVVVVDEELLLLQAAARRPPISIMATRPRLRLSLTMDPPISTARVFRTLPDDPSRVARYNTMNIL